MSFQDIDTKEFKSGKSNPLIKDEKKPKTVYATQSTKVLEEDHARLKKYAYEDDKKMFEVANDGIKMYEMFHHEGKRLGLSTDEAFAKAIELLKNSK